MKFKIFLNYCINFVLRVFYFFPKSKKIWIFGAWNGNRYSDNSRYFYEYLRERKYKKAKLIWITKNKELLKRKDIGEIYYNNSLKGIWYRLRAGVVFYTNGMQDFGELDFSNGSYIVALWHGMPLKKIYFASNKFENTKNKLKKKLKIIKNKLYFRCHRNLSIATSIETKDKLERCFSLCENNEFLISGQPRNDILVKNKLNYKIQDIIIGKYLPTHKKIITYMPTYRNIEKLKKEQIYRIENLIKNSRLKRILEENNSILIIKLHYLMKVNLEESNERIILLEDSQIECTQKLLKVTDILITDYSSVFIDFVLQEEKNTIFYGYDSKEYLEEDETGLFYDYDKLLKDYLVKEEKILLDKITEVFNNKSGNNKELNRFFNRETYQMSNFSKHILEKLEEKLKI